MEARGDGTLHLVRLDAGERIIGSLNRYLCGPGQGIRSGFISGIGAAAQCKIGDYDLESGAYSTRVVEQSCEITALTGKLTRIDAEPPVVEGESGHCPHQFLRINQPKQQTALPPAAGPADS